MKFKIGDEVGTKRTIAAKPFFYRCEMGYRCCRSAAIQLRMLHVVAAVVIALILMVFFYFIEWVFWLKLLVAIIVVCLLFVDTQLCYVAVARCYAYAGIKEWVGSVLYWAGAVDVFWRKENNI